MENDGSGPLDPMDFTPGPTHAPISVKRTADRKKKILLIALITLAALVLAGGIFLLITHKSKAKTPAASNATQTSTTANSNTTQQNSSTASSSTLKNYKSTTLNLSFSYPDNWTVKESTDKAEVVVASPHITYTRKDGTSANGSFTLKIRHGKIPDPIQQTLVKMIATNDSLIIAYDKPTANQRQYTNISYGGADATTFNVMVISGNATFKAGQAFGYGVDLTGADAYMFAAGYGADAGDTLAFDPIAKTTYDTATFQDGLAIIKSVQVN